MTLPWQAFGPSASLSTQKRVYSFTRTVLSSPPPYATESYRISTQPIKGPPQWNSEPVPSSTGRGYQRTSAKLRRDAQTATERHPHRLPPPSPITIIPIWSRLCRLLRLQRLPLPGHRWPPFWLGGSPKFNSWDQPWRLSRPSSPSPFLLHYLRRPGGDLKRRQPRVHC